MPAFGGIIPDININMNILSSLSAYDFIICYLKATN